MSFLRCLRDFGAFLSAAIGHWKVLLGGGVFIVGVAIWEHWSGQQLDWRWYLVAIAALLFWACFLAWRDERRAKCNLEIENGDLKSARNRREARRSRLADFKLDADKLRLKCFSDDSDPIEDVRQLQEEFRTFVTNEFGSAEILILNDILESWDAFQAAPPTWKHKVAFGMTSDTIRQIRSLLDKYC